MGDGKNVRERGLTGRSSNQWSVVRSQGSEKQRSGVGCNRIQFGAQIEMRFGSAQAGWRRRPRTGGLMQTSHRGWRLAASATVAVICVLPALGQAQSPSLAGRWVGTDRVLDNGEKLIAILELKQDGNQLTGTLKSESVSVDLHGTATGNHFELFGPRSATRPM